MANIIVQNNPITALPIPLYISGLDISVASTTVLAVGPGQARDSHNIIDMPVGYANLQGNVNPTPYNYPSSATYQSYNPYNPFQYASFNTVYQNGTPYPGNLFINSAVNGANGLDTGTLAASTAYNVWLIGDSRGFNPTAAVLSLQSSAFPTLPNGYDSYRLLGFAATNGSTQFVAANIFNQKYAKSYFLSPASSVLSGGTSTTFATVSLTTPVPTTSTTNVAVLLSVSFTPNVANDFVQLRPFGSTATTNLPTITGTTALTPQQQYIVVFAGVNTATPAIQYLVSSASDSVSLSVVGYTVTTA